MQKATLAELLTKVYSPWKDQWMDGGKEWLICYISFKALHIHEIKMGVTELGF